MTRTEARALPIGEAYALLTARKNLLEAVAEAQGGDAPRGETAPGAGVNRMGPNYGDAVMHRKGTRADFAAFLSPN